MSKNLGNIPREANMTEEQQQTYTNGFNRGRKAERERIIALLGDDAEIWHSENLQADLIALIKGENE